MSSSTCNSILLKLSFKNKDIMLNSFKTLTFCCIICKLGTNNHIPLHICRTIISRTYHHEICVRVKWDPNASFLALNLFLGGISISINVKTEVRAAATKEKKKQSCLRCVVDDSYLNKARRTWFTPKWYSDKLPICFDMSLLSLQYIMLYLTLSHGQFLHRILAISISFRFLYVIFQIGAVIG